MLVFWLMQSNPYQLLDFLVPRPNNCKFHIRAICEQPAFPKICITKPGRKRKYKEKEIFKKKERGERAGREEKQQLLSTLPRAQHFHFILRTTCKILGSPWCRWGNWGTERLSHLPKPHSWQRQRWKSGSGLPSLSLSLQHGASSPEAAPPSVTKLWEPSPSVEMGCRLAFLLWRKGQQIHMGILLPGQPLSHFPDSIIRFS